MEEEDLYDVRCAMTINGAQRVARGHVVSTGQHKPRTHPPMVFTFGDLRARITEAGAASGARLPADLTLLMVSRAATGAAGSQDDRLRAALALLAGSTDPASRPQLVQNLHAYRPDLPAAFAAALAPAAVRRRGHIVVAGRLRAGTPAYRPLESFPTASIEYVFVRDAADLHLVRITLRDARIAASAHEIDCLVDASHLSPALQSSLLLPLCTDAEFEAQIEPFDIGGAGAPPNPRRAAEEEEKGKVEEEKTERAKQAEEAEQAEARGTVQRSPPPLITVVHQVGVFASDVREYRRTRMLTTNAVDFLITRLLADKFAPFMIRNREVFYCGTEIAQVLIETAALNPALAPEALVALCFDEARAPRCVGNYYTEPVDAAAMARHPEWGVAIGGRRSLLVDRNFVFFTVNYGNSHWVLYLFWRPFRARTLDENDAALIFIFDSLPGCVAPDEHSRVLKMLKLFLMRMESVYLQNPLPHAHACRVVPPVSCGTQPPRSNACGFYAVATISLFLTSDEERAAAITMLRRGENPFGAALTFTPAQWEAKAQEITGWLQGAEIRET